MVRNLDIRVTIGMLFLQRKTTIVNMIIERT